MRYLDPRLLVLAATGLAAGCATSTENPFAGAFRVRAPSAHCDIVFASDMYSPTLPAPPELFCADSTGASAPERLTFCSTATTPCAMVEAAPATDSKRMVVRRVTSDTNADGRLDDADSAALVFINFETSAVAELVSQSDAVSGVDWSAVNDFVIYSAMGTGGKADLFMLDLATQPPTPHAITSTADVDEMRPRYGRVASYLVYEHVDASRKAAIWIMSVAANQELAASGEGQLRLGASGPVVGSNADPAVSYGDDSVAFRRLSDCSSLLPGAWDIFTVLRADGAAPARITSGCAYRGAPDWGRAGIVYGETDPGTGRSSLVLMDPATGTRRVLVTAPAGASLAYPRWLGASR